MSEQREIKVLKANERPKSKEEMEREHKIALMYVWIEVYFDKAQAHVERIAASRKRQAA